MGVLFNGTSTFYTSADPAATDFPDGDWCIGFWTRITDNTGIGGKYVYSSGGWQVAGSVNIYLRESGGSDPDLWRVGMPSFTFDSSSSPGGDSADRLIILQRNSDTFELWFCTFGGTASLEGSSTPGGVGALVAPGSMNIGRRTTAESDRYYSGDLGEFFKGSFALSSAQITALGRGLPAWALGQTLDCYLPMRDARTPQIDFVGSSDPTATDAGTSALHFPMAGVPGTAP